VLISYCTAYHHFRDEYRQAFVEAIISPSPLWQLHSDDRERNVCQANLASNTWQEAVSAIDPVQNCPNNTWGSL